MRISEKKFNENKRKALQWSNFKHKTYNECKRKFLYSYFNSLVKPSLLSTVEKLKKLQNINEWKGGALHKYINIAINNNSINEATTKFEREFFSNIKRSKSKEIFEFYYNYPLTNQQIEEVYRTVKVGLSNFWFYYQKNIKSKNYNGVPKPTFTLDISEKDFSEKITILFSPDLVLQEQDSVVIFEWKTTDNVFDENQFKLYYLVYSTVYSSHSILIKLVSLYPSLTEQDLIFSTNEIDEYIDFIKRSYFEIKDFLDSCSVFYEQDLEDLFSAVLEKFPKTTNISLCKFCKFRELCFDLNYNE